MDRRRFLKNLLVAGAAVMLAPLLPKAKSFNPTWVEKTGFAVCPPSQFTIAGRYVLIAPRDGDLFISDVEIPDDRWLPAAWIHSEVS